MSVEVILGRAGTGKTFACLSQMQKILAAKPFRTEIILLVPAYQTYRAELELAQAAGGSLNTWICSFQRFARQILSEVGGSTVPRISDVGRRLLLRKILIDRAEDLSYYRRAARQRGFAETLAAEIQELRSYSVDAEKILAAASNINDDELNAKIRDLATLYADFRAAIADKQNDDSDLLERAAELIKDSAAVRSAEIFVDGFIFFDPQQRKILRELFTHAKNVHITLPMDADLHSRENIRDVGIFNRAYKTLLAIRELAGEIKITRCENFSRFENDALAFIEQNFFKRVPEIFSGDTDGVKVVEAVNKRVEVEAVARDILKITRERGWHFRDIGIITRDVGYHDLVKAIFEIHAIPFFVDGKRAAAHHPLAELIRSALEILRGWKAEAIFRCLRTGFFDAAQDEIDLLENYVLEFGLKGEKIWAGTENWRWYRRNLDDPDDKISDAEAERRDKVDAIRRKVIAQILNFAAAFRKKNTARHFTAALYNFLDALHVYDKLSEWSTLEESRGDLALSKEHLKIWDDLVTLFDQIVDALDEENLPAREFEFIVSEGLDALQMSLIPPGLDEVTVSNFDQNSLQNSRAIYILGFSDSSFPMVAREKNLLSDADRLRLNEQHLEIPRGGSDVMLAEKFLVYRGLTEARNYLHISYPLANSEGDAMNPATILDRLKRIFPAVTPVTVGLEVLDNLGSQLELILGKRDLSKSAAEILYAPDKKMRGSVTRLETFNKCPFQYFAGYGLKLSERREYKVKPPDIGSILHSVMSRFGERLQAENRRWSDLSDAELETAVTEILDSLTDRFNNKILASSSAYAAQRERIKKVALLAIRRLSELDAVSEFHPEFFEETFGASATKALIYDVGGVKMELTGKIDRIDFSEDGKFFLIIDYKTGSAYLNLTEIFTGVNIQLLTYLMVANNLPEIGKRAPAGMMYYFLKFPARTVDSAKDAAKAVNDALKMAGWTLDEPEVITKIDGSDNLDFIKVQLKSDGQIHGSSRRYVKSREQFEILMRFAEEILKKTGAKILQGNIEAAPFKSQKTDACKYCAYAEICGKSGTGDVRAELDDNEILEKMKNLEGK